MSTFEDQFLFHDLIYKVYEDKNVIIHHHEAFQKLIDEFSCSLDIILQNIDLSHGTFYYIYLWHLGVSVLRDHHSNGFTSFLNENNNELCYIHCTHNKDNVVLYFHLAALADLYPKIYRISKLKAFI